MKLFFTICLLSFASVVNAAEVKSSLYFVEPMICKGQWNKRPPQYDDSYAKAGMKVTSFWSMRKKDCTLAPSSATMTEFARMNEEVKFDEKLSIAGWFGGPLRKEGSTVSAPYGVQPNAMELEITSTKVTRAGQRIDTLVGRYELYDDYYYDLTCEATVVANPSHVENNTSRCND